MSLGWYSHGSLVRSKISGFFDVVNLGRSNGTFGAGFRPRTGECAGLAMGRWPVFCLVWLVSIGIIPRSGTQIQVDTSNPVNSPADHCSLQEAIYAAEFGQAVALDQTDPDHPYATACVPSAGDWSTINLPGGTLTFATSWGGDTHNPFGPTATPIIFKKITILGHGTSETRTIV